MPNAGFVLIKRIRLDVTPEGECSRTQDQRESDRLIQAISVEKPANNVRVSEKKNGAGKVTRTPDLRITNALLYQLSYAGSERAAKYIEITPDRQAGKRLI